MANTSNLIGIGRHLEVASWDLLHCLRNDEGIVVTRPDMTTKEARRVVTFLSKVCRQAERVGW